jgi:galactan 5-O-arabinofuranosyltransferase
MGLAVGATVLFSVWAADIGRNALLRADQVSALATIELRFTLLAIPVLGVVAWYSQRGVRTGWRLVVRLSAALVAGLTGGFVGAGQVWALHGTPWGIEGQWGDQGRMILWGQQVISTGYVHNIYPPGVPTIAAFIAEHFYHGDVAMAYKPLLIMLLALSSPLVYLAWRMVLPPLAAAGVAILGSLAGAVPAKPWTPLIAMLLVPLFAKLAQWLRGSPRFSAWGAPLRGLWLGVLCAVLFLLYSGWHMWSALGVGALVLCVFPWRRAGASGRLRGLSLLAGFAVGFLPLAGPYARQMLGAGSTKDLYCAPWTLADPASTVFTYTLMGSPWPLLLVGLGLSVYFGLRKPAVLTALLFFASVWVMRFLFASRMAEDGNIRLFPHTGIELQYLLVVLFVLGIALAAQRIPLNTAQARQGVLAVLLVLFVLGGVGASAVADTGMPKPGNATWVSQELRRQDNGQCPPYAPGGKCLTMPITPTGTDVPSSGPLVCPKYGFDDQGNPVTKP